MDLRRIRPLAKHFIKDATQSLATLHSEITAKTEYLNSLLKKCRTIDEYTTFRVTFTTPDPLSDIKKHTSKIIIQQQISGDGILYLTGEFDEIDKVLSMERGNLASAGIVEFNEHIPVV